MQIRKKWLNQLKNFLNILKNIIWHLFAGESHQVVKITVPQSSFSRGSIRAGGSSFTTSCKFQGRHQSRIGGGSHSSFELYYRGGIRKGRGGGPHRSLELYFRGCITAGRGGGPHCSLKLYSRGGIRAGQREGFLNCIAGASYEPSQGQADSHSSRNLKSKGGNAEKRKYFRHGINTRGNIYTVTSSRT